MFNLSSNGSFTGTESYLRALTGLNIAKILASSGQLGVNALSRATPRDSGLGASSWTYQVRAGKSSCEIVWRNTDIESGFPVAIMLQYGYATGTGGYVQGRDYINPAMRPVFDKIEADIRRAVTSIR